MARISEKITPNQKLKAERELRGWSQKYVAEQIGADHYYLSRWERGAIAPSPYYRQKLCALFGKNAEELGLLREETSQESKAEPGEELDAVVTDTRLNDPAIPPPFANSYKLIGRDDLLQNLKQRLFDNKRIALSALNGIPGVGKTSLALALAHDDEVIEHFRDGILWSGLGPEPNVLSLLSHWGTLLGIAATEQATFSNIEAWTLAIRAAIGNRRILLVLDDVWKLEDALALKVGGPRCAYILTTRFPQLAIQFASDGVTAIEELNEADSLTLLAHLVPEFVARQPEEARELIHLVSGLPLALFLVGRYLQVQTYSGQQRRLQTALQRLRQVETRLNLAEAQALAERSPSLAAGQPGSLENLIEVSDQQLDEQARNALRALAVFPAKPHSFSEEAALAICNVPVEALDNLSDAGLLEARGPERYTLHQTISDYARVRLSDTTVHNRITRYYAEYVEKHSRDFEALDREFVNIDTALQSAFEHHLHADLVRIANSFAHFLDTKGLFTQAELHLQRSKDAATFLQDKAGLAGTLLNLGVVMIRRGDYTQAEAYLQEGLVWAREINHREHLIGLLQTSGMLAQRQGKFQQAEASLQEGLALARTSEDGALISLLLKDLGTIEAVQGNYDQAETYWQEGLILARQSDDREVVSLLLLNLGQLASERGDYQQAEIHLQEALSIARQIGHQEAISLLLTNLGVLAGDQQDYRQAESYLQEGLMVARRIGYRERIGLLLTNLGWIASEQGKYSQAETYFQESLELAYQIGHQWLICGTLRFLGELQITQKQFTDAEVTFRKVLELAAEGNQRMKGDALFGLARVAASRGNEIEARQMGEASLAVLASIGQGQANTVRQWLNTDECP